MFFIIYFPYTYQAFDIYVKILVTPINKLLDKIAIQLLLCMLYVRNIIVFLLYIIFKVSPAINCNEPSLFFLGYNFHYHNLMRDFGQFLNFISAAQSWRLIRIFCNVLVKIQMLSFLLSRDFYHKNFCEKPSLVKTACAFEITI